ncbi:hypothetical protein Tco_0472465 [Tanacetum coccineum]
MHHSKRQNHRFFMVMLRLVLYKASVLVVGRLTLGLFPSYTSCFSGLIQIVLRVLGPLVPLLALNRFGILLGESEEGRVASSGWPFVSAVPGLVAHLVTSLTLDSVRSCMMQGASFTQGKVSSIPTVFSWGGSISLDGFLPSILLLVVIIVAVVVVVVVAVIVNCALLPDPLASGLWWWLPPEFEALKR